MITWIKKYRVEFLVVVCLLSVSIILLYIISIMTGDSILKSYLMNFAPGLLLIIITVFLIERLLSKKATNLIYSRQEENLIYELKYNLVYLFQRYQDNVLPKKINEECFHRIREALDKTRPFDGDIQISWDDWQTLWKFYILTSHFSVNFRNNDIERAISSSMHRYNEEFRSLLQDLNRLILIEKNNDGPDLGPQILKINRMGKRGEPIICPSILIYTILCLHLIIQDVRNMIITALKFLNNNGDYLNIPRRNCRAPLGKENKQLKEEYISIKMIEEALDEGDIDTEEASLPEGTE